MKYKDGKPNGEWKSYHYNGSLRGIDNYKMENWKVIQRLTGITVNFTIEELIRVVSEKVVGAIFYQWKPLYFKDRHIHKWSEAGLTHHSQ